MYILNLRRVEDPTVVEGIARSEDPDKLWKLLESNFSTPRMEVIDGNPCVYMFREDGPLASYSPPVPGDDNIGVVNMGDLETKVKVVVEATIRQIEKQVRDSWQEVLDNTFEV
jgi:hypothetical protein